MFSWTVFAPPPCGTGRARFHEGNGSMQLIIDERADDRQRDALVKILSGEETDEMATVWWVFGAMSPNKHPPLFKQINLEVDVDARRARLEVPGMVQSSGEPIKNPVTGAEHRVRIDFRKASSSAWQRLAAAPARRRAQ